MDGRIDSEEHKNTVAIQTRKNVSYINTNLSSFLKLSLLKGEDDRGVKNEKMHLGRRRQLGQL